MNLLIPVLPLLVPLASLWAQDQERKILKTGRALTPKEQADARAAGVVHTEKIRIKVVQSIKPPEGLLLGLAAKLAGSFTPDIAGMSLGHGILIRRDCANYRDYRELFIHEFCHTAQVERYGSIRAFLVDYLRECLDPGYPNGPLERQADRTAKKIVRRS